MVQASDTVEVRLFRWVCVECGGICAFTADEDPSELPEREFLACPNCEKHSGSVRATVVRGYEPEPYELRDCSGCGSSGYLRGPDCYGCWATRHNKRRPCGACGATFAAHSAGRTDCANYVRT